MENYLDVAVTAKIMLASSQLCREKPEKPVPYN